MPQYKEIEAELERMRQAKDEIERQLAELQVRIERTERMVKQAPTDATASADPLVVSPKA